MSNIINNDDVCVIFGRFQPFHIGHVDHILNAINNNKFTYIGITNPDDRLIKSEKSDKNRSKKSSNPLNYFHRMNIIKKNLNELNIKNDTYEIIPFPINFPELIFNYAPSTNCTYYVTILDNDDNSWNFEKIKRLKKLGLCVKQFNFNRKISGTEIRILIKNKQKWKHLVPLSTYEYITQNKLEELF